MPEGVDQSREVRDHVLDQIPSPALQESEHREVGIPVIHLAKTPTGNHVRPRKGQQGRIGWRNHCAARQLLPQGIDVPADRNVLGDGRRRGGGLRQQEMRLDELPELLRRARPLRVVEGQNVLGRRLRNRVGELLAVGEEPRGFNRHIQVLKHDLGRIRRRRRCQRRLTGKQQRQADQRRNPDLTLSPLAPTLDAQVAPLATALSCSAPQYTCLRSQPSSALRPRHFCTMNF